MNSNILSIQHITRIVGNRRFQSFAIAAMVMVALVVLQVRQLSPEQTMVEIYSHCRLQPNDIQRIQNAFSQSGLSEFEIQNKRFLVPKNELAAYLNAIEQHDATPEELRDAPQDLIASNPFQSRAEKQARDQAAKKSKICKMVCRLPFVEQAWFELDLADEHSVFEKPTQSAVISVRSTTETEMTTHHIETIRQLVGAAYARLHPDDIVVIDLNAGVARTYQDQLRITPAQQIHFEQQRRYEQQIGQILEQFPGVSFTVYVDSPGPSPENQTASIPPPRKQIVAHQVASSTRPGANGFASIKSGRTPIATPDRAPTPNATALPNSFATKRLSVSIDVPQALVLSLFPADKPFDTNPHHTSQPTAETSQILQRKFKRLSSELIQKIRPVLPESAFKDRVDFPISVHLIRDPAPATITWEKQATELLTRHWPSIAVLMAGLMMFTIVSRPTHRTARRGNRNALTQKHHRPTREDDDPLDDGSTPPTDSQLAGLIDRDPDAAAKIIESWIRENG